MTDEEFRSSLTIDKFTSIIREQFAEQKKSLGIMNESVLSEIRGITSRIDSHDKQLASHEKRLDANEARTDMLSVQFELMKQEKLRNNVRITGLPQHALENPIETITIIADTINCAILPSELTCYADRNKSSLIVMFDNHGIKRLFMDKLRERKSLLVVEMFPESQSNSGVYVNDQLTPYFAKIFHEAWNAKKDGRLSSVSSLGGRIKVKRYANGMPITINTELDLIKAIESDPPAENRNDMSNDSSITVNSSKSELNESITRPPHKGTKKTTLHRERQFQPLHSRRLDQHHATGTSNSTNSAKSSSRSGSTHQNGTGGPSQATRGAHKKKK